MNLSRRAFFRGLAVAGGAATGAAAHASVKPAADDVGLLYDATRCVGCNACVARCKEENRLRADDAVDKLHDAPLDLDGNTKNIVFRASDGARRSFVKRQCMHCVDPACVSVCMMGALHRIGGGVVAYDQERCIGCRYCQVACAFDVPKFEWSSATPKIVKCELCKERLADGRVPACVEVCPRKAVIFGPRAALVEEAHARIDAAPDAYVNKVYGERDGGGTHVLYLSALPFEKLGLPRLGDAPLPSLQQAIRRGMYGGFIAPAALWAALGLVIFRNRRREEKQP